jgi:hypothetical protein
VAGGGAEAARLVVMFSTRGGQPTGLFDPPPVCSHQVRLHQRLGRGAPTRGVYDHRWDYPPSRRHGTSCARSVGAFKGATRLRMIQGLGMGGGIVGGDAVMGELRRRGGGTGAP